MARPRPGPAPGRAPSPFVTRPAESFGSRSGRTILMEGDMNPVRTAREYVIRGATRQAEGDLAGAIAEFDQALALDPHCWEASNNRGFLRQLQGDLGGAIGDFDRAIQLNLAYPEAHN